MYQTECANPKCKRGKDGGKAIVYAYAKNKLGELGKNYCSSFCEKEAKYDKRYSK